MSDWTPLRDSTQVARKDHVCEWCPEPIRKGEVYRSATGVVDGEILTGKWHPECDDAFQTLPSYDQESYQPHANKRGSTEEP